MRSLREALPRNVKDLSTEKITIQEEGSVDMTTMECRKELEDLILEVYENLQSDGVNILLPDEIARKIHGMVHLHRACSMSGDVAADGSLIACGPGCSHDPKDGQPESNNNDDGTPKIPEEEVFRVQQMIEAYMAQIDEEMTPMVEHAISVATTHVAVPSYNDMTEPESEEDVRESVLESIPESPVAPLSPVSLPWSAQVPSSVETASQYSMDDDLNTTESLNNQYDEIFQFMKQEFPDEAARYSPGLDATDVESCDGSVMDHDPAQDVTPPPSPRPVFTSKLPVLTAASRPRKQYVAPASVSKATMVKKTMPQPPPTTPFKRTPLPASLKNKVAMVPPTKSTRSLLRPPASVPKPTTVPLRTRKFSNASDCSDVIITSVPKQESKQDMAAKRREEKEKRELAAREEAQKLREHRRALAESKADAEKAIRAAKVDMVKRRREERDKRVLVIK
ncbi:hypothetical protein B5M09_007199 [Aphanomyces astaci]|uniref:Uncharacterized protein n=2 Tax=Aphanomyces astaci TaxID=112090 RepID=A0A425DF68_APHAT|nr:hypothetical protein B5M09_007199 [Aphanomyces astaci]